MARRYPSIARQSCCNEPIALSNKQESASSRRLAMQATPTRRVLSLPTSGNTEFAQGLSCGMNTEARAKGCGANDPSCDLGYRLMYFIGRLSQARGQKYGAERYQAIRTGCACPQGANARPGRRATGR